MAYLEYGKIDEKAEKRMNELLKKSFKTYWKKKRTFDIIVTSILILILAVSMLLVALLVFIDDPDGSKRNGRSRF